MTSAIALIKRFEGLRLEAYQDIGKIWTVGYGATGEGIHSGTVWTEAQAEADLEQRLDTLGAELAELLTVSAEPHQLAALLSFAYNVGIHALAGSTLLRRFNAGDVVGASDEFLRWNHVDGQVYPVLSLRRMTERRIFLDVTEPGGPT